MIKNEKRTLNLTLFSAGDVMNTTGGTVEAGVVTNENALSPEMKTFYDKTLITLAGANLVHEQFGQRRPIPRNGGKTVEFRRFSKLPKALTAITEGVTPAGNKLNVSAVSCTVDQYGDYIEQTDMLELTAVDNTIVEATRELASQAGLTLDTVVRNELIGGTNVMYAPKVSGGTETEITLRADITADCRLRVKDVFKAAAELKAVNAPKIGGSYVAIIHPYVAYDLMQEAGEQWIGIQKYADPEKILKGEIGTLAGVRFVESTEAKIFAPAEINNGLGRLTVAADVSAGTSVTVEETLTDASYTTPVPVYVNGVANTVTAVSVNADTGVATLTLGSAVTVEAGDMICGRGAGKDGSAVFCTLFIGENAYGVTDIEGGGLEHIVKQRGYGNDPLNQRSSVGWKATKVAKRLLEEYLIRYESGSEFSKTAEAN
ncbi:MAG: N4-gp56 family major capsid protein [Clostridia bacterium]|nr:N4-gp56 family major capsid protein [Clostridia bacterium]MBR5422986.1 N4-gp56 family major capsid protein [Clostridia bacterium]